MELSEHAVDALKKEWEQSRCLQLTNFFKPTPALAELTEFLSAQPPSYWSRSVHPYHPSQYTFAPGELDAEAEEAALAGARQALARGEFSYAFQRCEYHGDGCPMCCAMDFLRSEEVRALLSAVTGQELSGVVSIFASRYASGDFLTTHLDTGRGKLAFVLNLTQDWLPPFGGALQLIDCDWRTVVRTLSPKHNSLCIFQVEGEGVPHQVTQVPQGVHKQRLALSGWWG
jgi:hypothetical protein